MPGSEQQQGFNEIPQDPKFQYVWDGVNWVPMIQPLTGVGAPAASIKAYLWDGTGTQAIGFTGNAINAAITSSVLPAGAATSANQLLQLANDATIIGHIDGIEGILTGLAAINYATEPTLLANGVILTSLATEATLALLNAKIPALGAALTAASLPVNIASDQVVPISVAALPLPAGAATELTLANIDGNIDVALSTVAKEATLSNIDGNIDVALSTVATESTLSNIDGNIDVALSTRATEATLVLAEVHLGSIDTNFDVLLSTRASETTLANVYTDTQDLLTRFGVVGASPAANTLLDRLKTINDTQVAGHLVNLADGVGTPITSTASALDVNIASGSMLWNGPTLLNDGDIYSAATDGILVMGQDDSATYQSINVAPDGKVRTIIYGNTNDALRTNYVGKLEVLLNSAFTGQPFHSTLISGDTTLDVTVRQTVLPAGAATEATLLLINAKLPAQGTALIANSLPVNIASDQVVPISASALPLPAGAASAANQLLGNTSLAIIANDTTSLDNKIPAQGTALIINSLPVNIASDQVVPISSANLDVALSTIAKEATLASIDGNIDVLLSTRASEATLALLNGKVVACNTGAIAGTVFSKLQDGAGTNLTSTLVGSDQALDVNIVQTIGGGTPSATNLVITRLLTGAGPVQYLLLDASADSVTGYELMEINVHIDADNKKVEVGFYDGSNYKIMTEAISQKHKEHNFTFGGGIKAQSAEAPNARSSVVASVGGIATGDIWLYSNQGAGDCLAITLIYRTIT